MKTVAQMVAEIKASNSAYVTYGESDLGIPVKRTDAIADISAMDDEMIGEGTWAETHCPLDALCSCRLQAGRNGGRALCGDSKGLEDGGLEK